MVFQDISKFRLNHNVHLQVWNQGCAGQTFSQRGGAGRGDHENPRGGVGWGGAKMKIRGAVRGRTGQKNSTKVRKLLLEDLY